MVLPGTATSRGRMPAYDSSSGTGIGVVAQNAQVVDVARSRCVNAPDTRRHLSAHVRSCVVGCSRMMIDGRAGRSPWWPLGFRRALLPLWRPCPKTYRAVCN
jgi:hypothetical protein